MKARALRKRGGENMPLVHHDGIRLLFKYPTQSGFLPERGTQGVELNNRESASGGRGL
jgi:hypothetical protein